MELPASAASLAAEIRERRISAVEALDAHLARVAERNGPLTPVVALDEDAARAAAAAPTRRSPRARRRARCTACR